MKNLDAVSLSQVADDWQRAAQELSPEQKAEIRAELYRQLGLQEGRIQ
jgi:hypothetical protein